MILGRLGGIARHDRPVGNIETVSRVAVTRARGIEGDARGTSMRRKGRQVSLIEADSWNAAMSELGLAGDDVLPWHVRRANLLVEGLRLPREAGRIIAIGERVRIETAMECDPCNRMEAIRPGLKQALMPDWRGGVLGTVVIDGEIAVGDEVRILE